MVFSDIYSSMSSYEAEKMAAETVACSEAQRCLLSFTARRYTSAVYATVILFVSSSDTFLSSVKNFFSQTG